MTPLPQQLACAKRELALRRNVYPKWIDQGRMTQAVANAELDAMAAIVESIQKLVYLEEASNEMKCASPSDNI